MRRSASGWRHRHFAVGFGVKTNLESVSPTTGVLGFMPLVGVQTETTVVVEHNGISKREVFVTNRGSVPDNITQRMLTPRIGTETISTRRTLQHHLGPVGPISLRQSFANAGALLDRPVKSVREGLFAVAEIA